MKRQTTIGIFFLVMLNLLVGISCKAFDGNLIKRRNRIAFNSDLTIFGSQFRVCYERIKKDYFWGFSATLLSQDVVMDVKDSYLFFYRPERFRGSLAVRYGVPLLDMDRVNLYAVYQTGILYNSLDHGFRQFFFDGNTALLLGGGVKLDIRLYGQSGLTGEINIGKPYLLSAGYYIKFN